MLEEVFRSLFEEIDTDKLRREVENAQGAAPEFEPAEHAQDARPPHRDPLRRRRRGNRPAQRPPGHRHARRRSGLPRLPAVPPGPRHGHDLRPRAHARERFTEALSCLAYVSGVGIGKQGIATVLESATIEGGVVAEKIGESSRASG